MIKLDLGIGVLLTVVSAALLVPAIGYLGVAVTEPVIWRLCALFLAGFYGTISVETDIVFVFKPFFSPAYAGNRKTWHIVPSPHSGYVTIGHQKQSEG